MGTVRLTDSVQWLKAEETEIQNLDDERDSIFGRENLGEWGEVRRSERVYRKLPVVGLAAPEIPDSRTTATYSFVKSTGDGLRITLVALTASLSKTYTVTEELSLECNAGEAKVGSLYIPFEQVTQLFKPAGSIEWFEVDRLYPAHQDPTSPGLGATADVASSAELRKEADLDPKPFGGARSAAHKASINKEQSISKEVKIGGDIVDNVLSAEVTVAKVGGRVSVEFGYSLPANAGFTLYWLNPLAGACAVKST